MSRNLTGVVLELSRGGMRRGEGGNEIYTTLNPLTPHITGGGYVFYKTRFPFGTPDLFYIYIISILQ